MNAAKYSEWAKHYDPEFFELDFLEKSEINFNNKNVLEVGCGTGRFTQRIAPIVNNMVCIDPDKEALIVCRNHFHQNNIKILLGTLEVIPIPSDSFDIVVFPWSMYMIDEKKKNLQIAYNALKVGGKLVVLQANSGEFEEEVAKLYSHYSSLDAYGSAYNVLSEVIGSVFGNVVSTEMITYFLFDNVNQVIDCSLFFIEDEEGKLPSDEKITQFRERLTKYELLDGRIKMTDVVSVFLATKK